MNLSFKFTLILLIVSMSCHFTMLGQHTLDENQYPIPVIFDTDANNELDDQHALAYSQRYSSHCTTVENR